MEASKDELIAAVRGQQCHSQRLQLAREIMTPTELYSMMASVGERANGAHTTDSRSVVAITTLKQYLLGAKTEQQLAAAAEDAWSAFRENVSINNDKAIVALICACAASKDTFFAAYVYARWTGDGERASQINDAAVIIGERP